MELRLYLRQLQRGWWIIALTALSALNIALIASFLSTPLYRASARFVVSPNLTLTTRGSDIVNSLEALDKRSIVATYSEVLSSDSIYQDTAIALNMKPGELNDYNLTAVVMPDANILELAVEGPNPEQASLLANSVGQRAIDYVKGLYPVYNIDFLDYATPPRRPFQPNPARDVSLALALGLVLGSALAIISEQLKIPLDALRRRTQVDSLSSAYLRPYFQNTLLERELAHNQNSSLSLGLVRLDGLRDLIDTLPTVAVRRLLYEVNKILRSELRGNDIVGRWDEISFAVLLPSTPAAAAERTLVRIRQALSEKLEIERIDFELDPHTGVATALGREPSKTLIERAESALAKAHETSALTIFVTEKS
jgi:diguanylate cyclase (GGDEF)-like protein